VPLEKSSIKLGCERMSGFIEIWVKNMHHDTEYTTNIEH
jgi:hypothetical protein